MLTFMYSDRAVVRKVLGGNPGVFRVLVDRYAGVVHSVAYAYVHNAADAEDVAQETFTRFYQQLDRMAGYKRVGPWLVSVARNVSVDTLRKRGREAAAVKGAGPARAVVQNPVREELHRLLWEQLDALDGEAREVLILHYFMRKKAREIAVLLDVTPDAAAKRVQRARDELGRRLSDLLGEELDEIRPDARRAERIMAAVAAVPVAWKASAGTAAAAATAAGVATGASAAKVAMALAVILLLAVGGYFSYQKLSQPYWTQNITNQTHVTIEETAADAEAETAQDSHPGEASPADNEEPAAQAASAPPEKYPVITGVIHGRVMMNNGVPAAGATVTAENRPDMENIERIGEAMREFYKAIGMAPVSFTTTTDSSGQYELGEVGIATSSGYCPRYVVIARKPGLYAEMDYVNLTHLEREVTCDLTLHEDLALGGTVTDVQGPVNGAWLLCFPRKGGALLASAVYTKEDGAFLIEHLPAGAVYLNVNARGHLPLEYVTLQTGTMDNVVKLEAHTLVSGRVVVRETGEPVPNAYVWGQNRRIKGPANYQSQRDYVVTVVEAHADEAGRFTMTVAEPGEYALQATGKVGENVLTLAEPASISVGNQAISSLQVRMTAGTILSGRVIDGDTGRPVAGPAIISAKNEDKSASGDIDVDGSYELPGLPAGTFMLQAYAFRSFQRPPTIRDGGSVTIAPGELEKRYDIRLARAVSFAGRVEDESGQPVPGASVYLASGSGTVVPGDAISDLTGAFEVFPQQGQTLDAVYVQAKSGNAYSEAAGPYKLEEGQAGIVLQLASGGRLEGELVDRQGEPVNDAFVLAVPDDTDKLVLYQSRGRGSNNTFGRGQSQNLPVSGDGTFQGVSLQPGAYTLEVYLFSSLPDLPLARSRVTVQAGRTTRARLTVDTEGYGSISGRVLFGGAPAVDRPVSIDPIADEWVSRHTERTDADGEYFARHVLPGPVKVIVNTGLATPALDAAGWVREMKEVEVVAGEVVTVDFDIAGGDGAVEGYVLYNGVPPAACEVLLERADAPGAGGPRVRSDERGWYRAEKLASGLYLIEAKVGLSSAKVSEARSAQVEVKSGETVRMDIEVVGGDVAGTVAGLKADESAFIGVFPGDSQMPSWSVAALEALGDRVLADTRVWPGQTFSFEGLPPGDYLVGGAAVPQDSGWHALTVLSARIALEPVHVEAGAVSEVALVFEE